MWICSSSFSSIGFLLPPGADEHVEVVQLLLDTGDLGFEVHESFLLALEATPENGLSPTEQGAPPPPGTP